MNARPISRFVGYLMLVGASGVGAVFHARVFPEVIGGAVVLSGDADSIPAGLLVAQELGFILYLLPPLFLVLGALSIKWQVLHSPHVTHGLFFVLVVLYLVYTFCLVTPTLQLVIPMCCGVEQSAEVTTDIPR